VYTIVFLKNSVTNLIRNKEKSNPEARIEALEKKLNKHLESENKYNKRSGPAEIRTHDLRRLKDPF
jgi:hypothetical protein